MEISKMTKEGKRIGDYLLSTKLGQGSFGKIFLALQTTSDIQFAVKQINKTKINSNKKLKSLLKTEISIMREIDHPNIMKLFDLLETKNNYYMVLPFCEGGDLLAYMKRKHPKGFPEEKAVYFLKQIANGFQELRKRRVLHRDVKLENLFMREGKLLIGDFGFAKKGYSMAETKLGTPATMAYELLNCDLDEQFYDAKADLWSVGVVYYELLFGLLPFNGEDIKSLVKDIEKKMRKGIDFPGEVCEESKDLLKRIFVINPRRRISWKEFFHHPLFEKHSIVLDEKGGNFYSVLGNFKMADKIKTEENFNKNKEEGNIGKEEGFLDADEMIAKGDKIDLKSANVEEENVEEVKVIQEIDFKNIYLRYSHENEISLFLIFCLKRTQHIIKSRKYVNLHNQLFDLSILFLNKALLFNGRAFDSINNNKNFYDFNDQVFKKMINFPIYGKIHSTFSEIKKKLSSYKTIVVERIKIFEVKPELENILSSKISDDNFFNNNLMKIYINIKSDLESGKVKGDKKEVFFILFLAYLAAKSDERFPFLKKKRKMSTRFKWNKFYDAIEKLTEKELKALLHKE